MLVLEDFPRCPSEHWLQRFVPVIGPVVLIDLMNLALRNYAAVPTMDANGERCGGWFGTLRSVRGLIRDFRPSNVLVVWDGEGGSQARRSIMGEYKANRKVRINRSDDLGETAAEDRENLLKQLRLIGEYLSLLGVPQVRCDGVEADDLIAWAARHMGTPDVLIVSTDQDFLQLICDPTDASGMTRVRVWSPVKKILYDRDRFISGYGVLPENYRLMKAMTGDAGDNIKGTKGLGPKTVTKLFPALRDIEATPKQIIDAAKLMKDAVAKRLVADVGQFSKNLSLVDLTDPLMSATAGRQVREALEKELAVREIEMRIRLVKDGLTISDQAFVSPFRELSARRRRLHERVDDASEETVEG